MIETKQVKIRLSKGAKTPQYQSSGASGADLHAYIEKAVTIEPGKRDLIPAGIFLEIPQGYEVQIRPRSGLALKKGIMVVNSPGTIDSDYRGEIKVILFNSGEEAFVIEPDMRIAQMVLCPVIMLEFDKTEILAQSTRSSVGFGSTGTL